MSRASSQLRVFVHFKEDTVFAGEDVECTITFKNVESTKKPPHAAPARKAKNNDVLRAINPLDQLRAARSPSQVSLSLRQSNLFQSQSSNQQRPTSHLHKHNSSFSVVESANKQQTPELPGGGFHIASAGPEHKHGRKVSIVTLPGQTGPQRPTARHGRSASMQVGGDMGSSRRRPSLTGQRSYTMAALYSSHPQSPSPLSPFSKPGPLTARNNAANSPSDISQPLHHLRSRQPSDEHGEIPSETSFKFPPSSNQPPTAWKPPISIHSQQDSRDGQPWRKRSPNSAFPGHLSDISQGDDRGAPLTKVFSVRSMEGTPRSSLDMYSLSNNSNETLMSELPTQARRLLGGTPQLSRTPSVAGRPPPRSKTESILMGYAQLSGAFILDGSLVNQGPFEEVKRKAVVGGQGGGGVVGITRPAAEAGLFGSFGWNSIGESLGGLIGVSGPSSMKEMKGIADSNSIPLLSTSKSILFVDLNLAPGESRSYSYRFTLPRGLPPSHKGRAMKVSYNLVIGTHRAGSNKGQAQAIRQVEVPFRLLSGVNAQGEYLGHDLMSPYIILKDQARTSSIANPDFHSPQKEATDVNKPPSASSAGEFEAYVQHLLAKALQHSSTSLLSPTAETPWQRTPQSPRSPRHDSIVEAPMSSTSSLIEEAIRTSTNPRSPIHSPTNFTIARSSITIASLTISRPALKLGDTLTCVLDFSDAKLPCYAFEASLESSERVDPALAIRSPQSVERATRRVWASNVENAVWARRSVFRAQVPVDATPAFTTTGVSLDWCVRLELVVGVATPPYTPEETTEEQACSSQTKAERVLEVAHADERGVTLAAKHNLRCDSFKVEIPIRVYGAVVGNAGEEADLEGWAV